MQFPVPQFTEVEDKIIGPLTVKQFGIIFATGVIIFLPYSATKSVPLLVAFSLIFGLPAVFLAFGKMNGRPMYKAIGFFIDFLTSPKVLIFHKEILPSGYKVAKKEQVNLVEKQEVQLSDTKTRLKEVQRLLSQKAQEEVDLINKNNNKN